MAGLLIASFLCLFTGFEGPFAFFGKFKEIKQNFYDRCNLCLDDIFLELFG